MIVEIAVGTMGGILAAAIVILAAYRWYQLAVSPEGCPRARRYLTIFLSIVGLSAPSWVMVPIMAREYAESQRQNAIAQQEAEEREHCKKNSSGIIGQAVRPLTGPYNMGLGRIHGMHDEQVSDGGIRYWRRTAHGWLVLCHQRGIISKEEYDRAIALQKKNQDEYNASELAREKSNPAPLVPPKSWEKEFDDKMRGILK